MTDGEIGVDQELVPEDSLKTPFILPHRQNCFSYKLHFQKLNIKTDMMQSKMPELTKKI